MFPSLYFVFIFDYFIASKLCYYLVYPWDSHFWPVDRTQHVNRRKLCHTCKVIEKILVASRYMSCAVINGTDFHHQHMGPFTSISVIDHHQQSRLNFDNEDVADWSPAIITHFIILLYITTTDFETAFYWLDWSWAPVSFFVCSPDRNKYSMFFDDH